MSTEHIIEALADLERGLEKLRLALTADLEHPPVVSRNGVFKAIDAVAVVANHYGVAIGDILGASRRKEIIGPRQVTEYVLHDHMGLSYNTIGKLLERDHTTIVAGVKRVRARLSDDPGVEAVVRAVTGARVAHEHMAAT
jgi:chromosomal replication initiation ATPase DnaA